MSQKKQQPQTATQPNTSFSVGGSDDEKDEHQLRRRPTPFAKNLAPPPPPTNTPLPKVQFDRNSGDAANDGGGGRIVRHPTPFAELCELDEPSDGEVSLSSSPNNLAPVSAVGGKKK